MLTESSLPDFSAEIKVRINQSYRLVKNLGERPKKHHHVAYCIRLLSRLRGVAFVDEIYQLAANTEASGGLMTRNGSRRRTFGGVFFELATQQLTSDESAFYYNMQPWRIGLKAKPSAEMSDA